MRERPAPIGHEWQHDPRLPAHGPGKMNHRRVDRNQEVHECQDRGGVGHIRELRSEISNAEFRQPRCAADGGGGATGAGLAALRDERRPDPACASPATFAEPALGSGFMMLTAGIDAALGKSASRMTFFGAAAGG